MLKGADLDKLLDDDCIEQAGIDDDDDDDDCEVVEVKTPAAVAAEAAKDAVVEEKPITLCDGGAVMTYIARAKNSRGPRIADGRVIGYRAVEGEPLREAVLGESRSLPWALEAAARYMQPGEIVKVVARGEHCCADDEDATVDANIEREWRFELATASGDSKDKFRILVDERIVLATKLKDLGNAALKKGRQLRAIDYYKRGSAYMDVLEAEDLGAGMKDDVACAKNKRIRECQMPLLLNWSMVLIKRGLWEEAEEKCREILLDIDKDCVKALFRRGQCYIQLDRLDEARDDLKRAAELDPSVAPEVEKEMQKWKKKQQVQDAKDKGWAKKAFSKGLGDSRSKKVATPVPSTTAANGAPIAVEDDENEGMDIRVKDSSKTRIMPNAGYADASDPVKAEASGHPLMDMLQAHNKEAADQDDLTYARQREAIYNQFTRPQMRDN